MFRILRNIVVVVVFAMKCVGLNTASDESNVAEIKMEREDLQLESRIKGQNGNQQGSLTQRILPMMIIPFLLSSILIPPMLFSIAILFVKAALTAKIAVILMLINCFRRRTRGGGVFDHYVNDKDSRNDLVKEHYGYQGVEEPGIYVHKKRRKRDVYKI
ncbi:uncharacterized protein LOC126738676 [Anthonomus grandis grandis]|uniref:uncharacterized protein LOC126738676 n=1 Tax=Anthonomus grandis grandis TaxID=2921223 RepID=UPI002166869F|nr:uncharacterized protein LOC126738676 [Anthonomus grandis grandis]